MGKTGWYAAFAVAGLCAATVTLFTFLPRYIPAGPPLVAGIDLTDPSWLRFGDASQITTPENIVQISNDETGVTVGIRRHLPVPEGATLVQVEIEAAVKNVSRDLVLKQEARLFLAGRTADGRYLWEQRHEIAALSGSRGWRPVTRTFEVAPDAASLAIGAQLTGATGTLGIRNLTVRPVTEQAVFPYLANGLLILWGITGVAIGFILLRRMQSRWSRFAVAGVAAVAVGVTMAPGKTRRFLVDYVIGIPMDAVPKAMAISLNESFRQIPVPMDKLGHVLLFAALAALVRLSRRGDRIDLQATALLLFAATTEVLQFYAIDRSPAVSDWLLDAAGIAIGLAAAWSLQKLRLATPQPSGKEAR